MKQIQKILLGLLVVQIILAAIVFWPRPEVAASEPLLPGFKAEDALKLTIEDYDQNRVELKKEGSDWKLVLDDGSLYPAEAENFKTVLDSMAEMKTNRLVSRTETSHKQLKVAADDFVRKVSVEYADGKKSVFFIGTQPGSKSTHVRLDGKQEVYLAGVESTDLSATANAWIDTAYLSVKSEEITAMTLKNASGTLHFNKDSAGNWTLEEIGARPLDTSKVDTLVSRASNLRMTRPLGKQEDSAYGLGQPNAELTIAYKGEAGAKTVTLLIGAKDPEENFYVIKSSDSAFFVRADGYFVEDYINNKADDFVKLPATPTPAPQG